jgi:TolA-binding protein
MIAGDRLLAGVALASACWLPAPAASHAAPQDDEAVERLRYEAAQLERDGDLERALQKYELLSEQFPEAPAAAMALLRLVVGNLELARPEEAEEAALALIQTHPRSPQAAGGYTVLGRLRADRAADMAQLDEARVTFEDAVLLFPRTAFPEQPWRAEAAVRGARTALRLGRDAEAAGALAEVIDLEPGSVWTATARFELAALLLDQGDWSDAAELLQAVVDAAGDGDEERALAALAESRLALVHRLGLRPDTGQERWLASRVVSGAPERPAAVAARSDGLVAVTGAKGSTVVLDPAGRAVARWTHEDAERNAWLGTELVVTTTEAAATFPAGRNLRFAAPPSEKKPTIRPLVAVEPAPFGRWLVLAAKPARLLLYEPERRLHETLIADRGREPVDLASDRRGRFLVLDEEARSVVRFAVGAETGERLIAGGWDRAQALAVDPAGNIYVLDRGDRRIEMFDRAGNKLAGLGPVLPGGLELQRPSDLTVDGAGRLWIADARLGLVVLE